MKKVKSYRMISTISLIFWLSFIIILAFGYQAALAESSSTVYKWKMQSIDPPALIGPQVTQKGFCERIKKMSGGRLDITLYTAGELCPTMEIIGGLEKQMIDIAYTSGAYYTGTIPEGSLELVALPPLMLETLQDAYQVYWHMGLDDIMRDAYAKRGIYFLGSLFNTEPITNWSKKPLHTVEDLKGHKIRTWGYLAKTLQKLGASPAFIPHQEVYSSLAQGVIDGSMTAGSYYKRLKYYEVTPYY